jgi:hypothetical protein
MTFADGGEFDLDGDPGMWIGSCTTLDFLDSERGYSRRVGLPHLPWRQFS